VIPRLHNLTAEQYHADPCPIPSLSSSIASILIEQSPYHAWLAHPRLNANHTRTESSRFDLGSAAHMMLLERRTDRIVRVQADDWRTKAAKEARDAAQANGQYAVLERQYADIVAMCTVAQDYMLTTELGDILATGTPEQTCLWQEGAMWCRARPDMLSADLRVCLDYKSTASAAPEFIARQIGRMNYDLQSELYTRGLCNVLDHDVTFVFLFQEIQEPYACSLISLANAYREVGALKVRRALDLWTKCVTTNTWGGYSSKVLYAEPPAYEVIAAEQLNETQEIDNGV
jgi:hypothetical protein